MINTTGLLMDSWQELIDGVISVPVYKEGSVPEDEEGSYVELRAESEFENDTKHSFENDTIIVCDIVTMFNHAIDRSVVEGIDSEIKALIKSTPGIHNLQQQSGMQILNVIPQTTNYLEEYDGTKKYYRKIVRYTHRIIQTL